MLEHPLWQIPAMGAGKICKARLYDCTAHAHLSVVADLTSGEVMLIVNDYGKGLDRRCTLRPRDWRELIALLTEVDQAVRAGQVTDA